MLVGLEAYREVLESGNYIVGPGDEFLVAVTGMDEPLQSEVLAEGGLFIPKVGIVPVGGLRLAEAHRRIESWVAERFKVGQVMVQLRAPRQFPVSVAGLVHKPGIAVASGVERVSAVIEKRGGLREAGASRRNIRVFKSQDLAAGIEAIIRQGDPAGIPPGMLAKSRRVDLELYQLTGLSEHNPFVEDGDIVLIPPKGGEVGVLGAVYRPGFYELVPGDRISDLLRLGMGLTPQQDRRQVALFRYGDDRKTMDTLPVDIEAVLAGDETADLTMRDGDWLNFREVQNYKPYRTVSIRGEVERAGYYVLPQDGMRVRDLVELAGGFTARASLAEARLISQRQAEEEERDPELERLKTIPVADRTEHDNQYFIMKSRERSGKMVVDFYALFEEGDESQNLWLKPGDAVFVPKQQGTVIVSGQAANPGAVPYDPAYAVWDYIERAGGFGWRAATKDVLVIKARTGETKKASQVKQLEPGDRIWIKERPERDYWSIFTQAVEVVGQVTTVLLLVVTVTTR